MPSTSVVHARIEPATKKATEKVLHALGMTPTQAIRLFYRQIAMRREFPLELRIPNQLTAAVLSRSDKNQEIERFNRVDELYASWNE